MPQKTKAEIAAEKAALKESWEVVKLENEFDRAMNEGKDPNPFDVKAKKRSKGGGMDMGAKKPLSFKEQLAKAREEGTVEKSNTSKYLKKKSRGDKINALLKAATYLI